MRRSLFYLTLFLGVFCWSMPQAGAKDDDRKLSKTEKKELKKKEKEEKKAARRKAEKKADDEADDDDEDNKKKVDKKAVSNAWKALKTDYGKCKGNARYFIYAEYTTLTEAGENMLRQLVESEREFKAAKVNVLLINCEPMEKEAAIKLLKKIKCKLPMVMKDSKLEVEELPGYSPGTAPAITIVDPTGKVRKSGGPELLDSWHSIVGAKAPARKAKETRTEEPEDEPEK